MERNEYTVSISAFELFTRRYNQKYHQAKDRGTDIRLSAYERIYESDQAIARSFDLVYEFRTIPSITKIDDCGNYVA